MTTEYLTINYELPLTISVLSYSPATSGRFGGPPELTEPAEPAEIEFEVLTHSGQPLSESDFGEAAWQALYSEVLNAYEDQLADLRAEACVAAWEDQQAAQEDYDNYLLDK